MTFFAVEIPAEDDPARVEEVIIEIMSPGGAGGWILWRHADRKRGPATGVGWFQTDEQALADACEKLGSSRWRPVDDPS